MDSGSADGAPLSGPHSPVWWQMGAYIQGDTTTFYLKRQAGGAEGSRCLTGLSKQKSLIDFIHTLAIFYLNLEVLLP